MGSCYSSIGCRHHFILAMALRCFHLEVTRSAVKPTALRSFAGAAMIKLWQKMPACCRRPHTLASLFRYQSRQAEEPFSPGATASHFNHCLSHIQRSILQKISPALSQLFLQHVSFPEGPQRFPEARLCCS